MDGVKHHGEESRRFSLVSRIACVSAKDVLTRVCSEYECDQCGMRPLAELPLGEAEECYGASMLTTGFAATRDCVLQMHPPPAVMQDLAAQERGVQRVSHFGQVMDRCCRS